MADAFDDISDIIQSMDREKAIANVNAGPELPPDTAGEADQLSRRTGLPPAAVAADMDGVKAEQSASANREIVNGNPAIQTYVAGNPIAASASHDDLPALDKASKSWGLWNNLGAGWESGVLSEKRANMFEVGDSEGVRAATARMQALQSDTLSFKAANMVSGLLSNLSAASPAAGMVGLAGAAAGTVAAPGPGTAIGGVAAYGAALASGMAMDAGRVAGINHFIDSGEAKDENGNPFSIPARVIGSLATGILTTALFRLGGEGVSAPLGDMVSRSVAKAMESSVVAGVAVRAGALLSRQGLEFGAINGAMSAVDSLATELEKQVSPGHFRTIFNDPAARDDMLKRTYSAIGDGILLGGALGVAHGVVRLPGVGVNMVADHMRTVQIERDLEAFSNNLNDVQSTKTFQRSPELMQEFLESHQDAPKQVWMPAETALKLGFDVDPKLAELGQDVSVPATEYLTKVDPAKHEEVKGDLRFSEDGISKNEADELKKVEPEKVSRFDEEGFNTTGYHGSTDVIPEFDPNKTRLGRGVFFSEQPHMASDFAHQKLTDGDPAFFPEEPDFAEQMSKYVSANEAKDIATKTERLREVEKELGLGTDNYKENPELEAEHAKLYDELVGKARNITPMVSVDGIGGSPNVTKVKLHLGKNLEVDMGGKWTWEKEAEAIKSAKEGGYDSVTFKNNGVSGGEVPIDTFHTVFDAEQIKPYWHGSKDEAVAGGERLPVPSELIEGTPEGEAGRDLVALTEMAAEENKKAMWLQRFFANAKAMKMTGPVFAAWSKALERADKAEQQKIYSAGVKEAKRRLGKQWKDETAATKDEVTTELNARPDWAAESRLTEKGKDGIKLDKDFVDEVYHPDLYEDGWTKEPSAALDPAMFDKTTGLHPDDVANLVGYSSGREMVRDLMRLTKERQDSGESRQVYRDRKINEETTRRVEDKLGKFEEKVEEVARQAIATDGRMDVLTKETEWLGAQHGFPLDKAKMEAQVKTSFARKSVDGAVAIKAWEKQVGKWGAAAEKALLQGKGPEAFKFKQNQLYSLMFLKEAMALRNDLEAFKKISDRFTKTELPPGIHSEYNDHIQDILRKLGFDMKRAASDLDAKIGGDPDALQKFITRENNGKLRDIQVDGVVLTLRGAGINKLEVHQFGKLYDGLRSLIANGRIAQAMEVGGRKVEFGVLAKQAIDNLKSFGDKPFTKEMDQGFRHILRSADSMLMQLERLFRRWDKGDKFGPFQTVMQRIQNAKQAEAKWRADGDKFFRSVNFDSRDLGRDAINEKLHETDDFGGELRKMTKADVLGLAIHMGNKDNLYHLVEGMNSRITDAGKKWTEAAVKETVFQNLKPEDWNKVQQVWDKFAERWPELQELNWRTRGFAPPEIKSQELKLPTGETLKGGYFPLRKDYYRGDPLKVEVEGPGDEERYYRTQTAQSASELRTGALYPLNLSINDAKFAYLDMGHDVTHREAIRDAVTFFNQGGLMQAIDRSQGKEYSRLIPDYLKEISGPAGRNEIYGQSNMMDRLADKARLNWTLATLVGRFSTFAKHFPSVAAYSVNEVGLRPTISAFTKLYANSPTDAGKIHDFVTENSKEVQFRYSQHDRDLRELQENQFGEPGYSYKATQIAGWLMAAGDNATAKMVWLAEYEKHVAEHGHEKAAELGDVAVRRTHPTGALQDLPAIMRGRGVKKLLTMAYSFFSMSYNNMRETGWQAKEAYKMVGDGDLRGGMDKGFQVMARMFWTMTMAGTIESLVSPRHNQDKESWLGWGARNTMMPVLASFPLIRDMVKAIEFKGNLDTVDFGPQGTFLRNTFDSLHNAYKLTQHQQTSKKAVQHLIAAPSIFLPMPGAEQVGATSQGLSDVMRHKTHPKGMGDWLSILTLGHPAKGH